MPNEIEMYGIIGEDIMLRDVKAALAACDQSKPVVARIHSEGGAVFEGFAIHSAIKKYAGEKIAIVESAAFSIASFVAMAFDEIRIARNGYFLLHNPWAIVDGDDEEMARKSEMLAKLKEDMIAGYTDRTGMNENEVRAMLRTETYLNAQEAVDNGFADSIIDERVVDPAYAKSEHMPHRVFASLYGASGRGERREPERITMSESPTPVAATVADIKAIVPKAKNEFIVKCLEKGLTVDKVASEAARDLAEQNEQLEQELAEAKEKNTEIEGQIEASQKEAEQAKEAAAAAAKAGHQPVAKYHGGGATARERWNEEINKRLERGIKRDRAVAMVNRECPGLRSDMIQEANA